MAGGGGSAEKRGSGGGGGGGRRTYQAGGFNANDDTGREAMGSAGGRTERTCVGRAVACYCWRDGNGGAELGGRIGRTAAAREVRSSWFGCAHTSLIPRAGSTLGLAFLAKVAKFSKSWAAHRTGSAPRADGRASADRTGSGPSVTSGSPRRPAGQTGQLHPAIDPSGRRRDCHGRHSVRALRPERTAETALVARGPSASGGRGGPSRPSRHPRSTPAVHPRPTLGRHPAPGTARCVHRLARVPCPAPTAQSAPAAVLSGCAARAAGRAHRLSHGVRRRALGGVAARPWQAPETYSRRSPAPDTWPAPRSWCVHRTAGRAQRLSHGLGVGPGHRTLRSPPCPRPVPGTHRPVRTGGSPLGVCRPSGRQSAPPLARGPSASVGRSGGSSLAGTRDLLPPVPRARHLAGSTLVACDSNGRRGPAPLARARRRPRAPHAAFTAHSPSAVPRARHSPPSPHRRQSSRGVPLERPAERTASRTGSVGERWAEWRLVPSAPSGGRHSPAPLARARRRPRAPHAAFTALPASRARHPPPSPHRRQSSRGVPPERPAKPSASRTGSVSERWAEWRLVPSRHPSPTPAGSPRPTLGRQPARGVSTGRPA